MIVPEPVGAAGADVEVDAVEVVVMVAAAWWAYTWSDKIRGRCKTDARPATQYCTPPWMLEPRQPRVSTESEKRDWDVHAPLTSGFHAKNWASVICLSDSMTVQVSPDLEMRELPVIVKRNEANDALNRVVVGASSRRQQAS